MATNTIILLCVAITIVTFLYSSVGHAGASGYIATMTLFGLAPTVIKPSALLLNILVATIASWQFWRAGHFSWRLFWPFAALSVPFAFLGGYINLPSHLFEILVGLVLLYSALRFLFEGKKEESETHAPSTPVASWVVIRLDRHRWRNFFKPATDVFAMGKSERSGGYVGVVYFGEFDCWLTWKF